MPTNQKKILISGASIAGLTAAFWLHKQGVDIEIIEKKSISKTKKGYFLDFWGPGYDVAEKMGILPQLEKKNIRLDQFIFQSNQSTIDSRYQFDHIRRLLKNRLLNLQHGDLRHILAQAVSTFTTIQYEKTIEKITHQKESTHVTFSDGTQATYAYIVAADGVNSPLRKEIFNAEVDYRHDLGYQLIVFTQPNNGYSQSDLISYASIDKQATYAPIDANHIASYYSYRAQTPETKSLKEAFITQYGDMDWTMPVNPQEAIADQDILFDRLIQIKMPTWHKDRIVFTGDACQCLTLMSGQGASMAMTGAYVLANQLAKNPNSFETACRNYQDIIQPNIVIKQALAEQISHEYVPENKLGIIRRSYFTRRFFKNMYEATLTLPE